MSMLSLPTLTSPGYINLDFEVKCRNLLKVNFNLNENFHLFNNYLSLITVTGYSHDFEQLREELSKIHDEDQAVRNAYLKASEYANSSQSLVDSLVKAMHYKDSIDLIKVSKYWINTAGWVLTKWGVKQMKRYFW
ncbi:hypothetical protein ACFSJU_00135 [Paradesertivirga mongoliensis]|uniref:Uncharacterized protein n=1 Tax=Paradesertivirga mongoliensis TaxID=2100740 RepID=A0ABW4ZH09_9SPHI|nr:hypothetical protein [Pedobacter mongoliensis]